MWRLNYVVKVWVGLVYRLIDHSYTKEEILTCDPSRLPSMKGKCVQI